MRPITGTATGNGGPLPPQDLPRSQLESDCCLALCHFSAAVERPPVLLPPSPLPAHRSMDPAHRGSRRVYPGALPPELCRELLLIQRSLAVVGYRPHVQSLTLYELVLACPQLLPTVAKARQHIWAAVEEQFDSPCQVWPETTSLISWTAGASIGWHHDANR